MKLVYLYIILSISVFLHAQQDFQKIVTDQTDLQELREKFKNNKFVSQSKIKSNTIFDRYVDGNKKLIDSIEIILKSRDIESKKLLVRSMLDKPPRFIFDKEIQNVIINNLSCDETDLFWLIGRYKFNRYVEILESKLSTFSVSCQTDMLHWLGVDGTSKIGFTNLKQLLISSKIDHYEHNRLQNALYFYMNSKNKNIQSMAIDLALEIYSSKIIYKSLVKYDEFTAKDFEERLLYNLFTLGSKKSIPLAKSLYEQKKHEEIALTALVLNDHKKYKNELISRIKNDASYEYLGCNVSKYYLKASSDLSIIPLVIEKYFKNSPHNCARFFLDNNMQKELEKSFSSIDDKLFVEKVKEEIKIRSKTVYDVAKDLYNFGIIKDTDTLDFARNIMDYQKENQILLFDNNYKIDPYDYLLIHSPISSTYPWESNDFPIHYEEILHDVLKLSEIDLGKATVYSIATTNDDFSTAIHEIFVDFGEIGLSAVHISTSLYPDQKFIIDFLNLIPSKNNSNKKFFHDFISESNVLFYTDQTGYKNFSNYLKSAYKY